MPPVKVVALTQSAEILRADGSMRIEKAITYVDCPGAARKEQRNPGGQVHTDSRCKCEGPHDGDCGCIEACEVPQLQRARSPRLDGRSAVECAFA